MVTKVIPYLHYYVFKVILNYNIAQQAIAFICSPAGDGRRYSVLMFSRLFRETQKGRISTIVKFTLRIAMPILQTCLFLLGVTFFCMNFPRIAIKRWYLHWIISGRLGKEKVKVRLKCNVWQKRKLALVFSTCSRWFSCFCCFPVWPQIWTIRWLNLRCGKMYKMAQCMFLLKQSIPNHQ